MNEDEQREILLKHARHPKRVGELVDAHGRGQCHNPLCGDKIAVSFITENGILQNVKILPSGCSISTASASLMSEMVEGKSVAEVKEYINSVNENFLPANAKNPWPENLNLLSPFQRIRENPLKVPCVLISWIAMKEAVKMFEDSTKST